MRSVRLAIKLAATALLVGLGAMVLSAANPAHAQPQRPFGGPRPLAEEEPEVLGALCYTRRRTCRLPTARPPGKRCYCRVDGRRVRGRVR